MTGRAVGRALVLAAVATAGVLAAVPANAATTYYVTGTNSLAEQAQPHTDDVVRWLAGGSAIGVVCQVNDGGQDLGDGGNYTWQTSRTWDQLSDGDWVYDHFVSTPSQGSDGFSPGVPRCNIGTSSLNPNSYPWRVGPSTWIADGHGYYEGECTSFAAWAIRSDGRSHTKSPDWLGNADSWTGATSTSVPYVGEVAQWDPYVNGAGSAGHVAYVAAVNTDDTITIDEYNWLDSYNGDTGHALSVRTISAQAPSRYLKF